VRVANLADAAVSPDAQTAGVRTELADWLVSRDNPLTARVIANRIWQHHFGRGIVGTPSDFGIMGDWPTHPELLDWLASELIERGWSLKAMHRVIVCSSVYRTASRDAGDGIRDTGDGIRGTGYAERTSRNAQRESRIAKLVEADPENELLGRMPRQRLDGEAIRDAMLSAGGLLNREPFGPGVRPPLPPEVTITLLKNQWPVTEDESQHVRRSLYLFVRRNLPYPLFAVFDRPDTNQSCPERDETTIAPQALHLLNSGFAVDCAHALAERVERERPGDVQAQIRRAYQLTLSRFPAEEELQALSPFLDGSQPMSDLCLALFNLNEFVYLD
jgi:hypothetical protein